MTKHTPEGTGIISNVDSGIRPTPVRNVFPSFPTREEWETMSIIAKTFKDGGIMPSSIDTIPKMVVVLQAGKDMGLSPIESFNSFYFVNGKIAMYGEAVPSQIIRAGHTIRWGECTAHTATVTVTRGDNGESMTNTLTWQQATDRGYTRNAIWSRFPENMLKWRVLSMTAKFIVPDALKGIAIKEDVESEAATKESRFHDAETETRVTAESEDGTYNVRQGLEEALATEQQTLPVPEVKPRRRTKTAS